MKFWCYDDDDRPELIVCAVPYLRNQDIRTVEPGETIEDKTAKLEPGHPCPLCGAIQHPFVAQGLIREPDAVAQQITHLTDLIVQAEAMEVTNQQQAALTEAARKALIDGQAQQDIAKHQTVGAQQAYTGLKAGLATLQASFIDQKQAVFEKFGPLGVEQSEQSPSVWLAWLRERLQAWQAQVERKAMIQQQRADYELELQRLKAVIETRKEGLAQQQAAQARLKKEYVAKKAAREVLYADKKENEQEKYLDGAIFVAEEA